MPEISCAGECVLGNVLIYQVIFNRFSNKYNVSTNTGLVATRTLDGDRTVIGAQLPRRVVKVSINPKAHF